MPGDGRRAIRRHAFSVMPMARRILASASRPQMGAWTATKMRVDLGELALDLGEDVGARAQRRLVDHRGGDRAMLLQRGDERGQHMAYALAVRHRHGRGQRAGELVQHASELRARSSSISPVLSPK